MSRICVECGTRPCYPKQRRCEACKWASRKRKACDVCGCPTGWAHNKDTAGKTIMCRQCRNNLPRNDYRTPCIDCAAPSWGERCRTCADKARIVGSRYGAAADRAKRERHAPGLSAYERSNLLAHWRAQGRRCYICDAIADTVDHVMPLVLGGTNHEGNLAPCCRRCNSSKSDRLLCSMRYGKRVDTSGIEVVWAYRTVRAYTRRKAIKGEQLNLNECLACRALHCARGATCGNDACLAELNRRRARDHYRKKVGLKADLTLPTSKWVA